MPDILKKVTIKDVAREAGVSITAVSFVANNKNLRFVSEEKQELIRGVIERLDYRANPAAIALAKSRKGSRPVIDDVAREAGVSRATVSVALRGHPWVSDDARLEVKAAAEMLNYKPNIYAQQVARGLREQIMEKP